jgi:hypothetical protein
MNRGGRIALGLVFVLALMVCGLAAGAWTGGRYFVAPGSGLAGPAIVLGSGVIGAGIAGLLGLGLVFMLPPKWLLGAAVPVVIAGTAIAALIGKAYLDSRAQQDAHLQEAYAKMNKFKVTLVHAAGAADAPFHTMQADWGARSYTVTTGGTNPRTCTARLSGKEAVALLTALRNVEGLVLKYPDLCAAIAGPTLYELDFFIPEHKPPDSQGKLAITAACARQYPALSAPFEQAAKIVRQGEHEKTCR